MAEQYRIIGSKKGPLSLLAYPPPYQCWLTLSNDPDDTTVENWKELHEVIWENLGLPFSDSFFLRSFSELTPGEVNLIDNPYLISAHPVDTLHGWGNYFYSRTKRFSRDEAIEAIDILLKTGIRPLVWTDHASMSGNILHNSLGKMQPKVVTATGHSFDNLEYSTDLVRKLGICYIWNGTLEWNIIGQDRNLCRRLWYKESRKWQKNWKRRLFTFADQCLSPCSEYLNPKLFSYRSKNNRQYAKITFPDGISFYTFIRYGSWELADIRGLGKVICPNMLTSLVKSQGTAVIYTHLGKSLSKDTGPNEFKVPEKTKENLKYLKEVYEKGKVNISSTSRLLDYLVLRDHAQIKENKINFQPDGIRFTSLQGSNLKDHRFGIFSKTKDFIVSCDNRPVSVDVETVEDHIYIICFK
nr:hypothetical protein [uncultured Desulfobacter sp.]